MNFDFLLGNQQGFDPTRAAIQGMTLAEMSRRRRMGEEEDAFKQLDRQSDILANQAFARARQGGDPQSVFAELSQQGEAGALAIKKLATGLDAQAKSQADIEHKRAETESKRAGAAKDRAGITLDGLKHAATLGTGFASGQVPINDTTMGQAYEVARATLPEDVYRTMPADPAKFKDWWATIANPDTLSEIAKRAVDADKTRLEIKQMPEELAVRQGNLAETTRHHKQSEGAAWTAANAAKDANRVNEQGIVGKRVMDAEMKLADDYRTQSKGWQETASAIGKVNKALETATTNPGSALAAGTAFMKILDPNSVVRESELGMALNASGWMDRAANIAQQLQSGKVMTPQQAKNLKAAADDLYREAQAVQRQIDASFTKRAKDYGADPSRIIVDLGQNKGQGVTVKAPDGKTYSFPNESAAMEFKAKAGLI